MNTKMSGDRSSASVPQLLHQLCSHLANADQGITGNLYTIASNVLSTSSLRGSNPCDEPYLLEQIRQTLSQESEEQLDQFNLLYTNLCKPSTFQYKSSILSFLYNLSILNRNASSQLAISEFDKFRSSATTLTSSKSKHSITDNPSSESIKQIYNGFESRTFASKFQSSQATSVASTVWSRPEYPNTTSKLSTLHQTPTEIDLLQDVIYSFQGVEGKYIRKEAGGLGFVIDPKYAKNLSPIYRSLVERLIGTSFLHNQLKHYCEQNDKHTGVICQALIAILRDELSSYYKTVAIMQANMNRNSYMEHSDVGLRRAMHLIYDHHTKFEWLAYIAESCSDKKGGALISAIHGFLQHGSKCAQEVSGRVLTTVCKPLYIMLARWLLDGEINDPYNEFFIEIRDIIKVERLWHDKYHVKQQMVPSFITMEQAYRILATGKSINFLRQICKDGGELPGRGALQKLFKNTSAEALFAPEQSIEFHAILENVYKETSYRVVDLLKNKYGLYQHLQSLRKYLLLGQGDFIRHLMELLAPELNKPGQEIYCHTLTTILESAIRVTNAQFEDEDTLKRLNIKVLVPSKGDSGWDLFSLVYNVDGPVGTIFQPTMPLYESLFGALWRAKRMEFLLTNMRKQQITLAKQFKEIKELKPLMHIIHTLTGEMIHFLHQTQYYFLFEVLECSWAEMLNQVNRAECLDDIIRAHSKFLSSVQSGVLLDEESRSLFLNLISIYNFIVTLEGYQEVLYVTTSKENDAFIAYREKNVNGFGPTLKEETEAKGRITEFHKFLDTTRYQVKCLSQGYSVFVKEYLKLLSSSSNMNLQLLSVRLSFNNFYKTM